MKYKIYATLDCIDDRIPFTEYTSHEAERRYVRLIDAGIYSKVEMYCDHKLVKYWVK